MPNEITAKRNTRYTHDDEVAAYIAVQLEGSVAAASRVTDIPAPTIRQWKKRWDVEGFEEGGVQLVEKTVKETVSKASKIINLALDRLEKIVSTSDNVGHLIAAVDKLSAHNRLAQGKATVIREDRSIDTGQVSDTLIKYLDSMADATTERASVIDVEIVEQPQGELNPPESTFKKD